MSGFLDNLFGGGDSYVFMIFLILILLLLSGETY